MKIGYLARLRILNGTAAFADLALMNVCLLSAWLLFPRFLSANSVDNPSGMFLSWNAAYLLSAFVLAPVGTRELPTTRLLLRNCLRTGLVMALAHQAVVYLSGLPAASAWQVALTCIVLPPWLFASRLLSAHLVRHLREKRRIAFVGTSPTLSRMREVLSADRTSRTAIVGSFASAADARSVLADGMCQELYCCTNLPTDDIRDLLGRCENHLIRFYLVPDSSVLPDRPMTLSFEGPIPLLVARAEPLREPTNQLVKRLFDILVSAGFLLTVFPPLALIIAVLIKRSSPGPVFFLQRRNGLDGRDFTCIKFRTMRADPSCDGQAATEHDPRKFPFGDFLRRHNLDEIPQFVNVLRGDMSVVGPRPHATWTTEAYRDLVDRYMVRLYAKPGITGWAQVNGCRGETKTTDDMARRIKLDLWYISHWSLLLDVRIIWKTVRNMLFTDKGNVY